MNILYLHGLDSKLSPQKREILEHFGKVYAPDLDYYSDSNAVNTILETLPGEEINVVMGSSMDGFAAFHVANILHRPCLLFNPALVRRSVEQHIPQEDEMYNNMKQFVLGQQDEVVDPSETLNFLSKEFHPVTDIHVHLVPRLGHNIPLELFSEEVKSFFGKLCY